MRLDPITLKLKDMVDTKAKRNQYTKNVYFFYILKIQDYCSFSNLNSLLGGHSELDPLLSIPNRIVKRFSADDSVVFSTRT